MTEIHDKMNETSDEESQIDLIDDTHPKQIVTDPIPKTRTTMNGYEGKEIIRKG